ncbi:PTS transporter subunit EIIC [Enterococcus lactis]|uniref:PTS transporter subunit EIIC n=1 Tax=Enterococcus lactis TaxID=357441 RepID=UPI00280F8D4F|nr:PTS transporter subunit EIIC [Enterococcus faecium]
MPQTIPNGEEVIIGFQQKYLGSSDLFVTMIVSVLISMPYLRSVKTDKLVIKFPDSVPPMVSQSFEPLAIGVIIFIVIALFQMGLSLLTDVNIFDLINQFIGAPIMKLGESPTTFILVSFVCALLFFIGIYPVSIMAALTPVIMVLITADHFIT